MLSHGPEVLRAIRSKAEKNKPAEKKKLFNGPNRCVWQKLCHSQQSGKKQTS